MRKYFFVLIIIISGKFSLSAQNDNNSGLNTSAGNSVVFSNIDNLDSVVFNLSQAVDSLNYIWFPVSILSDDSIYSLDFSFKYNHNKLVFDSIIDRTNYIEFLSFYNGTDSTVRFTCNSLRKYTNDTVLVFVRFISLGGPIVDSDLNTIDVYLNGTHCSLKFISSLFNGMNEINNHSLSFYPNPANDLLYLEADRKCSLRIVDIKGRIVEELKEINCGTNVINIQNLEEGFYVLILNSGEKDFSERILIVK